MGSFWAYKGLNLAIVYISSIKFVVAQDSANFNGGKWIIRFKKIVSGRFWEDLVRGKLKLFSFFISVLFSMLYSS